MFENNNDYGYHAELSQRFASGANWFYWIAGVTLLTSVIGLLGGSWNFILSLGITQLIDGFAIYFSESFGEAPKVIAIVLDIFITAMVVGFGYLANKRHMWAYLTGIILFLLDSLISVVIFDWLGIIIHGFALVMMIRGYIAGRDLLALERDMAEAAQAADAGMSPALRSFLLFLVPLCGLYCLSSLALNLNIKLTFRVDLGTGPLLNRVLLRLLLLCAVRAHARASGARTTPAD